MGRLTPSTIAEIESAIADLEGVIKQLKHNLELLKSISAYEQTGLPHYRARHKRAAVADPSLN